MLNTPVALCVYNRPHLTELVFQEIARAKPRRLFVIADGPRSREEAQLCARTRAVTEQVEWDCDVAYDLSDVNLGCRRRVASGVDWVFSEVEEAIFLEDDCVPDQTFFPFCEAMLERYRDDSRVMMVSGANYLEHWKNDRQSYHFSHFGSIWGWASWSRSWKFYDITMAAWGDDKVKARIEGLLADEEVFRIQARRLDGLYNDPGDRHSWDLPWLFTRLAREGLTVVPAVNLISNRGSTDEQEPPLVHSLAKLRTTAMPFPLQHPDRVAVDRVYDKLHVRRIMEGWSRSPTIPVRPRVRLRAIYRRIYRAAQGLRRRVR